MAEEAKGNGVEGDAQDFKCNDFAAYKVSSTLSGFVFTQVRYAPLI